MKRIFSIFKGKKPDSKEIRTVSTTPVYSPSPAAYEEWAKEFNVGGLVNKFTVYPNETLEEMQLRYEKETKEIQLSQKKELIRNFQKECPQNYQFQKNEINSKYTLEFVL